MAKIRNNFKQFLSHNLSLYEFIVTLASFLINQAFINDQIKTIVKINNFYKLNSSLYQNLPLKI